MFKKISIIGVGLIGGSLGLDIRLKNLSKSVYGYSRKKENRHTAFKNGLIDHEAKTLEEAIEDADLIILATPVRTIEEHFKLIAEKAKNGAIIMDVGSSKFEILKKAEETLPSRLYFVGAHPMSGNEKSGPEAAREALFENKTCIIVPKKRTSQKIVDKISRFWKKVGSKTIILSAEQHDYAVALISHLPHVAAYVLMNSISSEMNIDRIKNLKGGGLMDTTRIAASSPVMWRDICLSNKSFLLDSMKIFEEQWKDLKKLIQNDDSKAIEKYFKKSASTREKLNS